MAIGTLLLAMLVSTPATAENDGAGPSLGQPAPAPPPGATPPQSAAPQSAHLDELTRTSSYDLWHDRYLAEADSSVNWTGAIAGCTPGTTSAAFKNGVLARINYFRAVAGVPDGVTLNPSYNSKAQEAALVMSANNNLSHNINAGWTCYSAAAAEAASSSNLALGGYGAEAINLYLADFGASNTAVGHRRWLLYPNTQEMGTGDVPSTGWFYAANALWVFDDNIWGPRPPTRDPYVAWPASGWTPWSVIPSRWSFSYPDADFSSAWVSVTKNGIAQPVTLYPVADGFGDNTIVWEMGGSPSIEATYHVTIHDVVSGTGTERFTYTAHAFDPNVRGGCHGLTDVPAWAEADICWLVASSYATGYPNHTYGPDRSLTRAQIARMLYRIEGSPPPGAGCGGLTDVPAWAHDAICWLVNSGHATGYPNHTYGPDRSLTRAQIARMLYRIEGSPPPGAGCGGLTDVPAWAHDAICWLVNSGHATGYPNHTFRPDVSLTRAQIARMLHRIHS